MPIFSQLLAPELRKSLITYWTSCIWVSYRWVHNNTFKVSFLSHPIKPAFPTSVNSVFPPSWATPRPQTRQCECCSKLLWLFSPSAHCPGSQIHLHYLLPTPRKNHPESVLPQWFRSMLLPLVFAPPTFPPMYWQGYLSKTQILS